MKKMTIREVARLANVSPSAVSIVLNDRKGVSDETRERVKGIIDQLGYAPNPSSRRLLFNKTNNIAILFQKKTSPLEHFFYSEINTAVLRECEDKGYNLIFASFVVENNEVIFPNLIKSYDVDGVIFYGDVDAAVLNSLAKYEIPYIVIDNHAMLPGVLSVSADYKHAAYVSVSHLLRLGHKKIAYIGNGQLTNFNTQTFAGYKQALQEKNISISAEWIQFDASQEESAYRCMKNILLSAKSPTAVFCCADIYAIGAIKCLKDLHYKVPDDVSVSGIDDILLARYTDPTITTVKVDKCEIGQKAINLLINLINGLSVASITIRPDQLIVRESTKEPS
ncbi:MAG: LacI family DNA-binding transcriptional regulator [Clostridia bacterium]|nr:LacI family DNA-binding transcriptional regulator [Clostridia bacterium]